MIDAVLHGTKWSLTLAAGTALLLSLPPAAASAPPEGASAGSAPTSSAPPARPAAPAGPALPAGVQEVRLGAAVRDRSATGVSRCIVPEPLPKPQRFEPGTTEIGYTIQVDPQVVKAVTAKVVGDTGCVEPWTQGCVGYTVCGGGVCQNQFGATLSCPGGKPLKKGSYKLALTVGGQTIELPFEIQ